MPSTSPPRAAPTAAGGPTPIRRSSFATSSVTTSKARPRTRSSPSWFAGDGSLNAAGLASARAPVTQYEIGLKNRGNLGGGRYTIELTGFYSKYSISSQEISQTNCKNILGIDAPTCVISGLYKDWGVELFSTYKNGGFNMVLSATYDSSKVSVAQGKPFLK